MDINKTINNIKNSKGFQYGLAAAVFGIIVYSGISLFSGGGNRSVPADTAQNAIAPIGSKQTGTINGKSANQKRILQEMKIDYQKAKNPNDVYLGTQIAQNPNSGTIGDYDVQVENKIYQTTLNNVKKENKQTTDNDDKKTEKKETKPKMLTLQNTNPTARQTDNTEEAPLQLNVLNKITTKDNLEDKIELYSEIYNYAHPLKNNGQLVVKQTYWKELSKYPQYSDLRPQTSAQNTATNTAAQIPAQQNGGQSIVKIVPGSTFFARLMIPIENIYAGDVKPIADIVNGPLKGYKIIGQAVPDASNSGLILKFTRLVAPDGSEFSIQAIGVQTKNLSPKFVDSLDRHLFPRITLATLATLADALFNGGDNNYAAPAQSVLSQELQNMIQEYPTEIKVNPKYFVVIFY
jgi:hypothetical protein